MQRAREGLISGRRVTERKSEGGRPWGPLRYPMGQMLKDRDELWPSLTREAYSSSLTQQVSPIWWKDCLKGHEKSYFEVGSGVGPGSGLGVRNRVWAQARTGPSLGVVRERKPANQGSMAG